MSPVRISSGALSQASENLETILVPHARSCGGSHSLEKLLSLFFTSLINEAQFELVDRNKGSPDVVSLAYEDRLMGLLEVGKDLAEFVADRQSVDRLHEPKVYTRGVECNCIYCPGVAAPGRAVQWRIIVKTAAPTDVAIMTTCIQKLR